MHGIHQCALRHHEGSCLLLGLEFSGALRHHEPTRNSWKFLASFPGRIGETAWQLPRVQTVYGCYVMVIAIFHYNILVHVILTIFPAVRLGLSCTWKQLFAARSTTEVK